MRREKMNLMEVVEIIEDAIMTSTLEIQFENDIELLKDRYNLLMDKIELDKKLDKAGLK